MSNIKKYLSAAREWYSHWGSTLLLTSQTKYVHPTHEQCGLTDIQNINNIMLFGLYFLYLTFLLLLLLFFTTLESKEGTLCLENILICFVFSPFVLLAFSFASYIGIVPKHIFFQTYFLTRTFVFLCPTSRDAHLMWITAPIWPLVHIFASISISTDLYLVFFHMQLQYSLATYKQKGCTYVHTCESLDYRCLGEIIRSEEEPCALK